MRGTQAKAPGQVTASRATSLRHFTAALRPCAREVLRVSSCSGLSRATFPFVVEIDDRSSFFKRPGASASNLSAPAPTAPEKSESEVLDASPVGRADKKRRVIDDDEEDKTETNSRLANTTANNVDSELPALPAAASPKQKTLDRMLGASETKVAPPLSQKKGMSAIVADVADIDIRIRVPYSALADVFTQIGETTSRTKIIELLRDLLRQVIAFSPKNLLPTVYLATNKLAPAYEGLELGIGESILMKAVADSTGRTLAMVKSSFQELGDLGLVAQASRTVQRMMFTPKPLTISGVYRVLREIAQESGHASQAKKKEKIQQLLVACRNNEPQFLIRSLEGKLRIGLAEQSVLVALAHAATYTPAKRDADEQQVYDASKGVKEAEWKERLEKATATIKSVYSELPNYDVLIPALLKHGIEDLPQHCYLTPGIPVKPMLAQPTKGITEVLDRFTNIPFTCEYKYDGERAQIHRLPDGSMQVYSRNLEDNTTKYPDIIAKLPHALQATTVSFILDCEAVAFDRAKNKILPFQVLSTRARKDVDIAAIKVEVLLFAFDLLYLNGKPLVKEPFSTRRAALYGAFKEVEHEFAFATHKDLSDTEEIQAFLNEAIAASCEGLMIKTLHADTIGSSYEPSKRSYKWLKVKKDYLQGMADSFDLVPIGAWHGKGKRTGVFGAYLLACFDEENDEYQAVTKIGTGFSDEMLQRHAAFFNEHLITVPRSYYRFGENAEPDVWFEPVQVWEVQAADLSISPAYKAAEGLVAANKGISLRFPRFMRIREDKTPEAATTSQQVADMYRRQQSAQSGPGLSQGGDDEDY